MTHFSRRTAAIAASLLVALTALGACGGSDSDSARTRNAQVAVTCAEGGECVVGDIGPGGGKVFYDAGTNEEWGRYLEVISPGWAGVDVWPIDPKASVCVDMESCPEFTQKNRTIGFGKSTWAEVSERECANCAQALLKKLNQGEIKDWFLPNIRELRALLKSGIDRSFDKDLYVSVSNSRTIISNYLVWRTGWVDPGAVSASGTNQYRIAPIRQFAATQTVAVEAEQSNVLEAVTNLRVKFENGKMIFDFDKPTKGLSPEGHFIFMDWEVLQGSNSIMVNGDSTSGSTGIFSFMRGTKLTAYVSSYTNATQPASIADTKKIDITIPMTDDAPAVEPPTDETVADEIVNVNQPILNVPPEGTEGEINPDAIIENLATEVPQAEVEKIEILVRAPASDPASDPAEDWQPVSTEKPTPYSIPADATSVTLRITTTDGDVIEQEKQVVHVASTGEAAVPEAAPVVITSTTTVPASVTTVKMPAATVTTTPSSKETDDAVTDSTVAPEEESADTTLHESTTDTTPVVTSESSDDSSGPNPILWLVIAIIAILVAMFGAKKMRDQKKQ